MTGQGGGESWRGSGKRWCKFSLVGAMGMVLQLGTLALLSAAGVHYLLATAVAVEAAVLHNFAWHQNFTWGDREGAILARLARFHLTNGATSILGNIVLMRLLVGYCGLPAVPANVASIAVCALANFLAADRVVFLGRRSPEADGARCSAIPHGTVAPLGLVLSAGSVCATTISDIARGLSPHESGQDPTHAGGGARATKPRVPKGSGRRAGVGVAHEQHSSL